LFDAARPSVSFGIWAQWIKIKFGKEISDANSKSDQRRFKQKFVAVIPTMYFQLAVGLWRNVEYPYVFGTQGARRIRAEPTAATIQRALTGGVAAGPG
jgi:hypothetical protein